MDPMGVCLVVTTQLWSDGIVDQREAGGAALKGVSTREMRCGWKKNESRGLQDTLLG